MYLQNFIDRDAPDAIKDAVRREAAAQQVFVADDYEANLSLQRSARGRSAGSNRCATSLRVTERSRATGRGPASSSRRRKKTTPNGSSGCVGSIS